MRRNFYNQADTKGMGGEVGGGSVLWKVKTQITIVRGSPKLVTGMKFKACHKRHVNDYISIYALAYNVQYAGTCSIFLRIFEIYAIVYTIV